MAGQLVQVATNTVTSAVASVTLTGIDSDDVYMVALSNLQPVTDTANLRIRFTSSGTPDTSSNYDRALKELNAGGSFVNYSSTNADYIAVDGSLSNATGEVANGVIYLFNFNNSSEYSFITYEASVVNSLSAHKGRQGGAVLTVAQATDGINFLMSSGNISSGTFTLYKVV